MENYPIIFDKIEQNTPEWHHIRSGKVTATGIGKLLVDGDYEYGFGKGAITYAKRLASQIVSGKVTPDDENVKRPWMGKAVQRGHALEKDARKKYELANFVSVKRVAFIQGGPHWGCSPDGVIFENGIIEGGTEIKCYTNSDKHFDALEGINGHINQIQFSMFSSKAKWWDFISFYPELGEDKELSVKRYYPDRFLHEVYKLKLELFGKLVGEYVERMRPTHLITH